MPDRQDALDDTDVTPHVDCAYCAWPEQCGDCKRQEAAVRADEQARIADWLRSCVALQDDGWFNIADKAADMIERGEHRGIRLPE